MSETESKFESRIVEHADVDPKTLVPNPANWRQHPSHQRAALADVLTEIGWVQDVIVNKTTGNLVDGHLRLGIALDNDEPAIPVGYVELSEDEERLVLATLDPLAELAVADAESLARLIEELEVDGESLQGLLDDLLQAVAEPDPVPGQDPVPEDFWPRVTFKLPPELKERWDEAMLRFDGEQDHEKIEALLDALPE
jgi:hypothetical protein